ncbi:MAG: sigma factor [Pyrinomonadaceae bacterium]
MKEKCRPLNHNQRKRRRTTQPLDSAVALHHPTHSSRLRCTPAEREALIEAHLPQVRYIADRLAAKLPPSVDRDDLIGAGVLGLLDAVEKFDRDARRDV